MSDWVFPDSRVHWFPTHWFPSILVPKLRLGNQDGEAPASRDWKLELPGLNSQAGAWELAQPLDR